MFSTINKDFKTENPWSQKRLLLSNKYPENYRVKLFNVFIFTALYSILDYNLKIQSQLIMFRINKSDKKSVLWNDIIHRANESQQHGVYKQGK